MALAMEGVLVLVRVIIFITDVKIIKAHERIRNTYACSKYGGTLQKAEYVNVLSMLPLIVVGVAHVLIFDVFILCARALGYTEMSNTLLLLREERVPEDLGRPVFQADSLFRLLSILFVLWCTHEPRKHQPELNTSLINPASEHCVVVARARNCGSTTNIYCRNIDNSGRGVGKPFQLRRSENTSFWTNEDVENEWIKVGCVVEYRVLTCYQSPLGRYCKQDGKQFIFHRNNRKPLLVSFHYYTNSTVVGRFFFEKLTLP